MLIYLYMNASSEALSTPSELLETDPTIQVELSVKDRLKPGQVFMVDYPALRETLQSIGAPTDTSELDIVYTQDLRALGAFRPSTNTIFINTRSNLSTIQDSLQHEIQHYVDHTNAPTTPLEYNRSMISNITGAALTPTASVSLGVTAASLLEYSGISTILPNSSEAIEMISSSAEQLNQVVLPFALGLIAINTVSYYLDPRERKARKTGRQSHPTVASIRKQR